MAEFFSRDVTKRYHEVVIPIREPWGTPWSEFSKAVASMRNYMRADYRRVNGVSTAALTKDAEQELDRKVFQWDDAVMMHVGDDEIVLRYELLDSKEG